jgi:protein involved in temperature-dependent protein secretion
MTERERRQKIIEHLRSGEAQSAADELAGSREPYPGDGLLHHAIGLAFASRGTLGAAREQLETAAKLTPDSAIILADLAQVRLAQGKGDEAAESAQTALSLEPSLPIARFTLGRAYLTAELARQGRRPAAPPAGFDFPIVDGRADGYLRALNEMELALDASPPFAAAVRAALAFAYSRAGHYYAALDQLRAQLVELPAGEEVDRVADRLRSCEYEIAREAYWSALGEEMPSSAEPDEAAHPEALLRAAHSCAVAGDEAALASALERARAAGYEPRPALVARYNAEDAIFQQVSDAHYFIAAGLECVYEGGLRFLPFGLLQSVTFGPPAQWRSAGVEFLSGDRAEVVVPSLYRLSHRSPNELVQSGRFTQFKYGPGETRYARAIGSRNMTSEESVIPFADLKSLRFI